MIIMAVANANFSINHTYQTRRLPQTSRNHTTRVSAFISSRLFTESHSLPKIMLSQVQQMLTTHYVNLGCYIMRNLVSYTGHLVLSEKRSRGSYGELGTCHERLSDAKYTQNFGVEIS